jgi:hypothetical protein
VNPHAGLGDGDADGEADGDGDGEGEGRGRGGRLASAAGAPTPHTSTAATTAAMPATSRPPSGTVLPTTVTLGSPTTGNPYKTVTSLRPPSSAHEEGPRLAAELLRFLG